VVVITLDEIDAERASERRADETLAGAGDPHHDIKASVQGGSRSSVLEQSRDRLWLKDTAVVWLVA
jgi:hypothetical protein